MFWKSIALGRCGKADRVKINRQKYEDDLHSSYILGFIQAETERAGLRQTGLLSPDEIDGEIQIKCVELYDKFRKLPTNKSFTLPIDVGFFTNTNVNEAPREL